MDNIWYRNPSKSVFIGRCGGDKKNEWPRRTDKSQTLKKTKKKIYIATETVDNVRKNEK